MSDHVVEAMARAIFLSVDHIPEVSKMVIAEPPHE